jgi:hypothetical protein
MHVVEKRPSIQARPPGRAGFQFQFHIGVGGGGFFVEGTSGAGSLPLLAGVLDRTSQMKTTKR